jgi:hypothetical protein
MTFMGWLETALGFILWASVEWDLFATIVLPRTVNPKLRVSARVVRRSWPPWAALGGAIRRPQYRLTFLAVYGPLTIVLLMIVWGTLTILAFALIYHGLGANFRVAEGSVGFGTLFYMSASTFTTLGMGDVTTTDPAARTLILFEAGAGIVFLSLLISYMPVLHQAYVAREVGSALLHSRAGRPPTAYALLDRYHGAAALEVLRENLREAERWMAEVLQSHISHPVLVFYRAQHVGESWLAALTTILDSCALMTVVCDGLPAAQARLTYAMGLRLAEDLSRALALPVESQVTERLAAPAALGLLTNLRDTGIHALVPEAATEQLLQLTHEYEVYLVALSAWLRVPLPAWHLPNEPNVQRG